MPQQTDAKFDRVTAVARPAYFANPLALGTDLPVPTGGSAAAHNTTLRIWANTDLSAQIADLSSLCPLVLGASRDWTFPAEVGPRRIHRLIEGSSYYEFERSGHYPFVEEHDDFVRVLNEWLDATPTDASSTIV